MKATVFHLGISVPSSSSNNFKVIHTPVIEANYHSRIDPREISDFLQINPIVLILSQNGVKGLQLWMNYFGLESEFFNKVEFWTIGERTHECLQKGLNIISSYPEEMTGAGVIKALHSAKKYQILLISGKELRTKFISSLAESGINYYHFPVYKTQIVKNDLLQSSFEDSPDHYLVFTSS